jgi:uncharacterized protein YutE (UPF0331/DUF86 family)
VDEHEIEARLRRILACVAALKRKQALSYDEFVGTHDALSAVEYDLQVAIQAAIDVGLHLLADAPVPVATSYRDVFRLLGDAGILPRDFAARLMPMAGFRNVLVHLYMEVDTRKVYDVLQGNLGDLERYVEVVRRYVAERASGR